MKLDIWVKHVVNACSRIKLDIWDDYRELNKKRFESTTSGINAYILINIYT